MSGPDPSVTRIAGPWRHHDVHANGIRFQCVEALPAQDDETPPTARPLVIMLHGFASFWWSWRHQLRGLSDARVVAVDGTLPEAVDDRKGRIAVSGPMQHDREMSLRPAMVELHP